MASSSSATTGEDVVSAINEVLSAFEKRIAGGTWCADQSKPSEVSPLHLALALAELMRMINPATGRVHAAKKIKGKRGDSRHKPPIKDDYEEEEASESLELQKVIRLDEQPKCIKGGKMRDYQVQDVMSCLPINF